MATHDDIVITIRQTLESYLEQVDPEDIDTDDLAESIALQLEHHTNT